jgi:hypothetical protein
MTTGAANMEAIVKQNTVLRMVKLFFCCSSDELIIARGSRSKVLLGQKMKARVSVQISL